MNELIDTSIIPDPYNPVTGDVYKAENPQNARDCLDYRRFSYFKDHELQTHVIPSNIVVYDIYKDNFSSGHVRLNVDGANRLHICHDVNAFVRWLASIPNLKPVGRVIQK
jgi:hypothetical protein